MQVTVEEAIDTTWSVPSFDVRFWLGAKRSYCVIIPVINEGPRIANLLQRMTQSNVASHADIIIADGGSTDGSLQSEKLKQQFVCGLIVKTGPGKLSSQLRCAYAFALSQGYEGIITIDGNDKDDPDAIPRFVEALANGIDFVQASRYLRGGIAENTPLSRWFAIRCIHAPLLSLCSGMNWTDTTQGFRAYSRRLLLDSRIAPFRDVFSGYELLAYLSYRAPRLGFRCVELPTARQYPSHGKVPTKISHFRGNLAVFTVLIQACRGKFNI